VGKSIIVEVMVVGTEDGDGVCFVRYESRFGLRWRWYYNVSSAEILRVGRTLDRLQNLGTWQVRPARLSEVGYVAEKVAWVPGLDATRLEHYAI